MDKIYFFLALIALCWLALLMNLLGHFLKRFEVARKVSVALQWQAFLLFLLGLVAGIACIYQFVNDGFEFIPIALLSSLFISPLVVCAVRFYRIVKPHGPKP